MNLDPVQQNDRIPYFHSSAYKNRDKSLQFQKRFISSYSGTSCEKWKGVNFSKQFNIQHLAHDIFLQEINILFVFQYFIFKAINSENVKKQMKMCSILIYTFFPLHNWFHVLIRCEEINKYQKEMQNPSIYVFMEPESHEPFSLTSTWTDLFLVSYWV